MLKRLKQIVFFYVLFFFKWIVVFSQSGVIKGFVYDKKTGEPIPYVNVVLLGTKIGTITDNNGFFLFSKLKPGKYTLRLSFIGYDTLIIDLYLKENETITRKFFLEESVISLSEVSISAEKTTKIEKTLISMTKITPKFIERLPSIGAEPDFVQYLQVIPGVIFTGDQGGQIFIRGGAPVHNKILLDEMTIFNPFHSIGFFSVFDTDIIRSADVFTGAFNAEYGSRISSVIDIKTKDGNKNKHCGKISATTFGYKATLEGPIYKSDDIAKTNITYLLSLKSSYIKESSKLLYKYVDTLGIPFTFNDYYGKISLTTENGSKVNFFGFKFYDKVKYRALSLYEWNNFGFGSNIILVPVGTNLILKINFSFSDYLITLKEADNLPRKSQLKNFLIKANINQYLQNSELKYGLEVGNIKTNFIFYNLYKKEIKEEENSPEINGFIQYNLKVNEKFLFDIGLRTQYYASSSISKLTLEPRFAGKYIATNKLRIKLGSGYYTQNILSANSDRDVVNLFYGFLSDVDISRLPTYFKSKEINNPLHRAIHFVCGLELDITNFLDVNFEPYYKKFIFLVNTNRNKIFDDTGDNWLIPDVLKKDFIAEEGNAYGIDFSLKYDYKRNYLWIAYSLAYVSRFDDYIKYNPIYDRRHNLNILFNRNFGKNLDWNINIRWQYGSGLPFTKTAGYYEMLEIYNINSNLAEINAQLGILYGELNKGRLPDYHRLDLSIEKIYDLFKNSTLKLIFSITNVYNRKNIFYYDRFKNEFINQLPIIPSFGLNLTY